MNKNSKFMSLPLPVLFILALSMVVINAESKEQSKIITITGMVFTADENDFGEASEVGILVEHKIDVERYYVENSAKGKELLDQTLNMVSVTGMTYTDKNGKKWIVVTSWKLIEFEDTEGRDAEDEPSNEE